MSVAQLHERTRQLALGEVIAGRYRVVGFLGSGGMGEVYDVEHISLRRHFALKVLRGEFACDADTVKRFTREARAMASLESEYVVGIVDFGKTTGNTPYFVMERLRGHDLRHELMRSAPLSIPQTVSIGIEACFGLQAVHDAGFVHRDLKPANIFVTKRLNGASRYRLLDFGVVKSAAADSTQQGSFVGTIRYMAPEQILEKGVVGPRTDIYALGAILYECLTARVPFEADAVERVLFKILNDRPLPLSRFRRDIPAALDAIIMRALARDPERRFSDATEFANALFAYAGQGYRFLGAFDAMGASGGTIESTVSPDVPLRRARRIGIRRGLVVASALAAIVGGIAWRYEGLRHPKERAPTALGEPVQEVRPTLTQAVSSLPAMPLTATHAATSLPATAYVRVSLEPPPARLSEERHKPRENPKRQVDRSAPQRKKDLTVDANYPLPGVDAINPYAN